MSAVLALVAGLAKDSGVLKDLVRDPRQLINAAGLDTTALSKLGSVFSSLVPPGARTTAPRATAGTQVDSVAILGAVSLAAVTGTIAVLGTVAIVALNGDRSSDS